MFTTLGEGGRERDCSALSLSTGCSNLGREKADSLGSLGRINFLGRDQSMGVVNEFKCIMESNPGNCDFFQLKRQKVRSHPKRVNIYTVVLRKARMEP